MKDYFNNLTKIIPDFLYKIKSYKYPSCSNCGSIILITKIDLINSTIDYTCEFCLEDNKKNYKFINFFNRQIMYFPESIRLIKECYFHKKKITHFCRTCKRVYCEDCKGKHKDPEHQFYNVTNEIIKKSKIDNINKEIELQKDFFNKLDLDTLINFYNNNYNCKYDKNKKIPSDILFNNKNFIKILVRNIKIKSSILYFIDIIIKNNCEYPNDYFAIQNMLSIPAIFNLTDIVIISKYENKILKILENLITESIKILRVYQKEYLFEYMDIITFKFDTPTPNQNKLWNYYEKLPVLYIENTDLIIYFHKEKIICFNYKTGEIVDWLNIPFRDSYFNFCKNNIFVVYNRSNIKIYEYKGEKINEIYSKENIGFIVYAHPIFEGKYILIMLSHNYEILLYNDKKNTYEHFCKLDSTPSDKQYGQAGKEIPIDYLRTPTEVYFLGFVPIIYTDKQYPGEFSCGNLYIKKFSINSENKIIYKKEFLPGNFQFVNEIKIITPKKIAINHKINNIQKLAVYDLEKRQIESVLYLKDKKGLEFVLKRIKNLYPTIKPSYLSELYLPEKYTNIYLLKKDNKNEATFAANNSDIIEFKIFKYNINERI